MKHHLRDHIGLRHLPQFSALLLLWGAGCAQPNATQSEPPDDLAMTWAKFDNKGAQQAAYDYFYPKQIVDYFPKMDTVSRAADKTSDFPDQLLDIKRKAAFKAGAENNKKEEAERPKAATVEESQKKKDPSWDNVRPRRIVAPFAKSNEDALTESEIFGRNAWVAWCGGNERFWDWLAGRSFGFTDLLKVVDGRERAIRFRDAGLINEPEMQLASGPSEFGLWLDVSADERIRKWRREYLQKTFEQLINVSHPSQRGRPDYTGPKTPGGYNSDGYGDSGYIAKDLYVPPPEIYGLSSGVVGLRLFPNPDFDKQAHSRWNAQKYYDDENYFSDPKLVRPFRVGMSCGFCHISFHPLSPPRDLLNPGWENISGNIGAQYLRIRSVFGNLLKKDNFVYHVLDSQPPGTIDTSLIPSDNINNTNAMNSIFNVPQRVVLSFKNPKETLSTSSKSQPNAWGNPMQMLPGDQVKHATKRDDDKVPKKLWDAFEAYGLTEELKKSNELSRCVPRILFDGADSIGAWGALARVYLNIGTYSEQWEKIHNPLVGFTPQKPFRIRDCEDHSVYWHATQLRVNAIRDYFLKITPPMRLLDTPGGMKLAEPIDEAKLRERARVERRDFATLKPREVARHVDLSQLGAGRLAFAKNCIVCHSSIQPESPESDAKFLWQGEKAPAAYDALRAKIGNARKEKYQEWAMAGEFWDHDPGQWLRHPDYLEWAKIVIERPSFWTNNYLSTDYRIPVNLVGTNSARAMATNAVRDRMWSDFSSESYKSMPSAGPIRYYDPFAKDWKLYTPRHKHLGKMDEVAEGGGGPGFYRVPTLISIWATAPLLHNNSLGNLTNDPSVEGRLLAFDDAIRKLLWPEKRLEGSSDHRGMPYNNASPERLKSDNGLIWRTTEESHLVLKGPYVPQTLFGRNRTYQMLLTWFPWANRITPPWLASVLFIGGALFLLLIACPKRRFALGIVITILATLAAACVYWDIGNTDWLKWFYELNPSYLALGILILIGLTYIALYTQKVAHWFGVAYLAIGAMGFLIAGFGRLWPVCREYLIYAGFAASFLLLVLGQRKGLKAQLSTWLSIPAFVLAVILLVVHWQLELIEDRVRLLHVPIWIPSLALLTVGLVFRFFFPGDFGKLVRVAAYANLILAIAIGGITYFLNGSIGEVRIGPIPKGTPVNLLANINPEASHAELQEAVAISVQTFSEIKSKHLSDDQAQKMIRERVAPALLNVSKCPDFVMDQGHYFEWFKGMSDEDKNALIELLKTF